MDSIDAPRSTSATFQETADRPAETVARKIVDQYARARKASAMAEADHRHPERIRELYLQNAEPRICAPVAALSSRDEETTHLMRVAVAFKLTALVVVLGLIATLALTA